METISDLLKKELIWESKENSPFYTTKEYPFEACWLRINDFPDEPMWTLFFNGEEIDFDDDPDNWIINHNLKPEEKKVIPYYLCLRSSLKCNYLASQWLWLLDFK